MAIASLCNRLYNLWYSLTDLKMDQCLENDLIVPSKFLSDNDITLTLDPFSLSTTPGRNFSKKPPVLFQFRPNIITNHPINFQDKFFTHAEEVGIPEPDPSPAVRLERIFNRERLPFYRGRSLAHYIDSWVMDGYPRYLPSGVPDLATFCGIQGVGDPHALNTETRGLQRSGPAANIQWETYIYEYKRQKPNGGTRHPHLILLGAQSCNGKDNTISLGELTTIVTAMRCRAYQPAVFDEKAILVGDAEQSIDGNFMPFDKRKLAFTDEKRFPVMMVSLVGPNHARLIYACMDGLKLCIRMSVCREILPENEETLHYIASILLSSPLHESP